MVEQISLNFFFQPILDGYGFVRVMYVFFLGVVPFISLSLFVFFYWRQNRPWFISQTSANEYVLKHLHDVKMPKNLQITDKKLVFSTNAQVWRDWH